MFAKLIVYKNYTFEQITPLRQKYPKQLDWIVCTLLESTVLGKQDALLGLGADSVVPR